MKKKLLGAFLTVALISSILCSCGRDALSESQNSVVSEIVDTTESITTSAPTKAIVEETTEPQTEAQSDFDFVKTVESTYICGQKLSYPITWGQFGEDFALITENVSISKENHYVTTNVKYKDYYLGIFGFIGCNSVDEINEDTVIQFISIGNNDMDFFGNSKITVNNLSLGIDHSQLFDALGDDYREGVGYDQITYKNDIGLYRFTFNEEDSLITVGLNVIKE